MDTLKVSTAPRANLAPGVATTSTSELLGMVLRQEPPQAFWRILQRARKSLVAEPFLADLEASVEAAVELCAQMDSLRRYQHGWAALYDTAVDLTAVREADAVLAALGRRIREFLGSEAVYLMLDNAERTETKMRFAVGVASPRFKTLCLPFGAGVGGVVAETGEPYFTSNYMADKRINHHEAVTEVVQEEGLVAILGVPLRLAGEISGVLFAADRRDRHYRPEEIAYLASFAALAVAALSNAQQFEELSETVANLKEANRRERDYRHSIEWSATAHERLSRLVIEGGDRVALVDGIAEILAAPVTVLDENGALLACSAHYTTETDQNVQRVVRDVLAANTAAYQIAGRPCWATAIRAGGAPLGALVVERELLTSVECRTFERAAQVVAGLLLNDRAIAEADQRVRGELVEDLLRGRSASFQAVARRLTLLQIDVARLTVVVAMRSSDSDTASAARAVSAIVREFGGIAGQHEGYIAAILPGTDAAATASALVRRLSSTTDAVYTAASDGPITNPTQLPEAFRVAWQCLEAMSALGRSGEVADSGSLSFYRFLLAQQSSSDVENMIDAALGDVIRYDREHSAQLLETLASYLQLGGNVARTSRASHIHPNTLYKRLQRITELLGDGWDQYDKRLQIELAIALLQLKGQYPKSESNS